MDYVAVLVEVGSIQKYIFNSNRLRENLGASYLVAAATGKWAFEAVAGIKKKDNLTNAGAIDPGKHFDTHQLDVEVIYSGGGNFVAIFRHDTNGSDVMTFGRLLSEKVLSGAPGLQLLIGMSKPATWGTGSLQDVIAGLRGDLKRQAAKLPASRPLLGLGVTVACRSTGLAAVGFDRDGPFSAEIEAKLDSADEAKSQLRNAVPLGDPDRFEYTDELDKLGRSEGDTSYVAVIHADGNGIGEWFGSFIGKGNTDREYIAKQRESSNKIADLSTKALRAAMARVEAWMSHEVEKDDKDRHVKPVKEGDHWLMPVRPIVFGGDDLTIVCDGRIGVSLATVYLRAFEQAARDVGAKLSACAGVSIVKVHYPFARAYELADDLAGKAKMFRRGKFVAGSSNTGLLFNGSAMDWHIATGGLSGDIDAIRAREYVGGGLIARPVALDQDAAAGVQTWPNVAKSVQAFAEEPAWVEMRSKAKALRDSIREGDAAVERFLTLFSGGKILPLSDAAGDKGGKQRVYFDALELADRYVSIDSDEANHE